MVKMHDIISTDVGRSFLCGDILLQETQSVTCLFDTSA